MKPTALVTVNVRFLKSSSGRIGSAALRSTNANATSERTPTAISTIIWAESHGQVVPPRLVKSTIAERPPASSDAPT